MNYKVKDNNNNMERLVRLLVGILLLDNITRRYICIYLSVYCVFSSIKDTTTVILIKL